MGDAKPKGKRAPRNVSKKIKRACCLNKDLQLKIKIGSPFKWKAG